MSIENLQEVSGQLEALIKPKLPKPKLSVEDQVRVDWLLSIVGETVKTLLHENGLDNFGTPMAADKAEVTALEASSKVYDALFTVRELLCWDSMPPSDHISDEQRAAIWAAMEEAQLACKQEARR
jgi:hypothetical protein